MNALEVNAFVAAVSPPQGTQALSRYLYAAGKALGGKSDATLAKQFGINPVTLASWKRRGKLTDEAYTLFISMLPTKIIHHGLHTPMTSKRAREAVIILIKDTDGDPLRIGADRGIEATAFFLGGLLAMAEFLADLAEEDVRAASDIARLMRGGFIHMGGDARFAARSGFHF